MSSSMRQRLSQGREVHGRALAAAPSLPCEHGFHGPDLSTRVVSSSKFFTRTPSLPKSRGTGRVARIIEAGRSTFNEEERLAAYEEAQRLIWDDAAFVWVFNLANTAVWRTNVQGLVIRCNADIDFRTTSFS